jgi:hypothetical protein
MPAQFRADNCRTSAGRGSARDFSEPLARSGAYLTDEVFLYRVVGTVPDGIDELVELEDCYLLDVVRVRLAELHARRLRLVTPM